jgi:uncharacterized membrane protein YbhN (UPF0104 family)
LVSLIGAAALLPFANSHAGDESLRWVIAISVLAGVAGCLVLWGSGRVGSVRVHILGRLQRELASLAGSIATLTKQPAAGGAVFLLACANQLLPVVAIWLLANDLGVSLALVDIALITFVASLVATIPIALAGWGIREGAYVFLFGLYGVASHTAFIISLLYGMALAISAAPGAVLLLRGEGQWREGQGSAPRPGRI